MCGRSRARREDGWQATWSGRRFVPPYVTYRCMQLVASPHAHVSPDPSDFLSLGSCPFFLFILFGMPHHPFIFLVFSHSYLNIHSFHFYSLLPLPPLFFLVPSHRYFTIQLPGTSVICVLIPYITCHRIHHNYFSDILKSYSLTNTSLSLSTTTL